MTKNKNFLSRLKNLEAFHKHIINSIEEVTEKTEMRLGKIETKLFRFADKLMMLDFSVSEKRKAAQEKVEAKIKSNRDQQETDMNILKEQFESQIKCIELQLVTKEKQIAELEIIVNKKEESMKTNLKNVIRIETSKNAKKINTSDEKMSDIVKRVDEVEEKIKVIDDFSTKAKKSSKVTIKFDQCEQEVNTKTELEMHIQNSHEVYQLKCNECDKKFITEWRLKKHITVNHGKKRERNCHYFNSNTRCPFEELGCKFQHVVSNTYKFGDECRFNMCQFKHY